MPVMSYNNNIVLNYLDIVPHYTKSEFFISEAILIISLAEPLNFDTVSANSTVNDFISAFLSSILRVTLREIANLDRISLTEIPKLLSSDLEMRYMCLPLISKVFILAFWYIGICIPVKLTTPDSAVGPKFSVSLAQSMISFNKRSFISNLLALRLSRIVRNAAMASKAITEALRITDQSSRKVYSQFAGVADILGVLVN